MKNTLYFGTALAAAAVLSVGGDWPNSERIYIPKGPRVGERKKAIKDRTEIKKRRKQRSRK